MARFVGPYMGVPGDSTRRTTTQELPLGTKVRGEGASEWVYIKAGASIAQYDACRFSGSATGYDNVIPTSAANQYVVGTADAAFASGEYGFIQSDGVCTTKVVAATAAGSLLVTSGTAGTLALAVATDLAGAVAGVALVTGVAAGSAVALR